MIDGSELTVRRTAAASAQAASYLAPGVVHRHVVVGAGSAGQVLPEVYAAVRDVELTQVFNRMGSGAEALVERLRAAGLAAEVIDDLPPDGVHLATTLHARGQVDAKTT